MRNPILDDIAKLMTDAAGVAQGMRKEFETSMSGLLERWLADQEIPTREEVEALRESVRRLDEEREGLAARVAALEAELRAKRKGGTAKKAARITKQSDKGGSVEDDSPDFEDPSPVKAESESSTGGTVDAGPSTDQDSGDGTNGTTKSDLG